MDNKFNSAKRVFYKLVNEISEYLIDNKLESMILGISGGIDSTVCAAICSEVSKKTSIPLIGRSLTILNKPEETASSAKVGFAFCNDFTDLNLSKIYNTYLDFINKFEGNLDSSSNQTPIANGNIQARLRMIYLYNLASINKGIVIDTINKSEWDLGFWTLHGDVGDIAPLFQLFKTEVYTLAQWLAEDFYYNLYSNSEDLRKSEAIKQSINLIPTDGLGISNSDVEQFGVKSYAEVDDCLINWQDYDWLKKNGSWEGEELPENYRKILDRVNTSHFKRDGMYKCLAFTWGDERLI